MTRAVFLLPILALLQSNPNDRLFPSRSPDEVSAPASSASPRAASVSTPPAYDVALRQEPWEKLPDRQISRVGQGTLALRPQQWRHGETENFLFHHRGLSGALQIEFDLWYVANSLGTEKADSAKKSHVYVFADEKEWQKFVALSRTLPWTHNLAIGGEVFLNVRAAGGGFDSQTLADETTDAAVARIYPGRRWPDWLNEGFAEYMGAASVAARGLAFAALESAETLRRHDHG